MDYQLPDSLYNLLPVEHRRRDAEMHYTLKAFLELIREQVNIIKEDIDQLWDNFFIESCQEWIIPYIGDLVGNNPLHNITSRARADVAKTIYYRRRKGTLPMLEEMARDITGWGCHAVEFFDILNWTQSMNHLRPHNLDYPVINKPGIDDKVNDTLTENHTNAVRCLDTLDLVDSPFDTVSHNVDVRNINHFDGWYNIKNIGFFLWRLKSYPASKVYARRVESQDIGCYHFSTLGNPIPLFNNPDWEGDEAGLAGEVHVPAPIRPFAFHFRTEDYYYQTESTESDTTNEPSVNISNVESKDIICRNLKDWKTPPKDKVAIDVKLGRIYFGADKLPPDPRVVIVSYHYGFSADLGSGQYLRTATLTDPKEASWECAVKKETAGDIATAAQTMLTYDTLEEAVSAWINAGRINGIIHIKDSATYNEALEIDIPPSRWLVIQADNEQRPTLILQKPLKITSMIEGSNSGCTLSGLLIEGFIEVEGNLERLNLSHCTVVPGGAFNDDGAPAYAGIPSITVVSSENLSLEIDHCITGALSLREDMVQLIVRDSIVDGLGDDAVVGLIDTDIYGPPATLERVTVLGNVRVKEMIMASEVIFAGDLDCRRTQSGCIRYSYLDEIETSKTPRRFRCQPDLAITHEESDLARTLTAEEKLNIMIKIQPGFTSTEYGHPGYCRLSINCPVEISRGAEDESEMGVFQHLGQPHREANLYQRLGEYLPFGLKPGLIYVT